MSHSREFPDSVFKKLLKVRGGCRCSDPGAYPPCSNCVNEMTDDEATEILQDFADELPRYELLELQQIFIDNDYSGQI